MPGSAHWIAALHDNNPDVRISAVEAVARLADSERVPLLVGMLGDPEWRVRKTAANDLKQCQPTPPLLDRLIAAVTRSEDPWQRMTAIDVVVSLGASDEEDGPVMQALLGALKTTGIDQRKFVVEVLGLMGTAAAVGPLIGELHAEDENLQVSTLDALAKIGDRHALPAVLERLQEGTAPVRFAALTALQQLGDPLAEAAALRAVDDPALRSAAMDVLGHIGGAPAVPPLWRWWTTGTAQERNNALAALDRIMRRLSHAQRDELAGALRLQYRPEHQVELLARLESSDPVVQRAGISLAGWVREPAAVTPLVHLLGGELGGEAQQALSMMAGDHIGRLLKMLPRSTPTIFRALIEVLAGTADPSVLPVMHDALASNDPRVRRAAALGIAAQDNRDLAPALVRLLLDRDPDVQDAAVWALGRCRNDAVVASIIDLLEHESPAVRVLAARTLGLSRAAQGRDSLVRALHDPDPAVRTAAVVSLDGLGDGSGHGPGGEPGLATLTDHLLLALGDEAPSVRLEAARALQRRESTLPIHWWRCLADDPDQWVRAVAARAAARGGAAHAAALQRYLRDESGAVRIAALEAMIEHPEAGDLAGIREAMRSDDPDIIAAALKAVSALLVRRPADASTAGDRSNQLVEEMLQTLLHPVWTVREAGLRALSLLDIDRARQRLEQLAADDPHPQIRDAASRLLSSESMRRSHPQPAGSEPR